jgi:hypothetical protein
MYKENVKEMLRKQDWFNLYNRFLTLKKSEINSLFTPVNLNKIAIFMNAKSLLVLILNLIFS